MKWISNAFAPQQRGAARPTVWFVLAGVMALLVLAGGAWTAWAGRSGAKKAVSGVADIVAGGSGMAHVWVGSGDGWVLMIQVTRQGDQLSGSLDEIALKESDPTTVAPSHAAFTGVVDGLALTLTIPEGLGFTTSVSGTLSGDAMTLHLPQGDGSIANVTLEPASVDTYNRKAAAVQDSAKASADARASAAAAAADEAARERTQESIDRAAATVAADVKALQDAVGQSPDFSGFKSDLADAQKFLSQAKADAGKAAGETDPSAACDSANASRDDANAVQDAANGVHDETNSIDSAIASVNGASEQLRNDLGAYEEAAAAMPTYTPINSPNKAVIQSLLGQASKQAGSWKATANQYESRVAGLVTQAGKIAEQAQTRFC
jgi:hypothetical protein